jgi:DNA repair protein RecN (Recombination protein N)
MLTSLQIENFALVDQLSLEFGAGLNVLTGETGAGKSIILDALDAALGGKVNQRMIRTGAERATIEATFDLDSAIARWLQTEDIESIDESSVICSRELTVTKTGLRSRSRVNGVLVNKQQIETLRDRLLEITAQGQTVQLGSPTVQRDWLDGFGGTDLLEQREQVADAHSAMQHASKALEKRRQFEQQRLQQLDIFEYQARELQEANLGDANELEQLQQERGRLAHSVELQKQSYQVYQALYQNEQGGNACSDLLGNAELILTDMTKYDAGLQPILEMVIEAIAQVEEAGRQINQYGEGLETDPTRLDEVEERIIQLKQICRKYGPTLAEAIAYNERIQKDLEELSGSGQSLEVLEQNYETRRLELEMAADQLTKLRQKAARDLESLLLGELKPLAMDKVQFQVELQPSPLTALGGDRIVFQFSPNPGEPLQPLAETASGGEMSRFLLALKACFSQVDFVSSMVFDEIDVGVSGRVAQAIAEKLHQLGRQHQVLCVTHQAIVAAIADQHYRVTKQVEEADSPEGVRTLVKVMPLDEQQRRIELAQIASGKSDDEAIAFAESLLAQAANTRLGNVIPISSKVGKVKRGGRSRATK